MATKTQEVLTLEGAKIAVAAAEKKALGDALRDVLNECCVLRACCAIR
jgi:hypothetical protein